MSILSNFDIFGQTLDLSYILQSKYYATKCPWKYLHMGQKLQDGKKVLQMSVTNLYSKSRPIQTIHPTDLGLLPPAQEFSPSWTARKRVQEMVKFHENPGNLYFQKLAENRLKSGKLKKIRPLYSNNF